jgi:hypothetical protein
MSLDQVPEQVGIAFDGVGALERGPARRIIATSLVVVAYGVVGVEIAGIGRKCA